MTYTTYKTERKECHKLNRI